MSSATIRAAEERAERDEIRTASVTLRRHHPAATEGSPGTPGPNAQGAR